ncbi:MAG: TetR family transcriptional regulator [Lachnospiraceae bacterium]|nr:TetR family transcriptional regulator [Lachnospiraceae bacterium]
MEQLSLRKVAMACNVSHAAPYSHFANKEEVLSAMQLHITEQFTGIGRNNYRIRRPT